MKDSTNTIQPPPADSEAASTVLREMHEELRRLREMVTTIQTRLTNTAPTHLIRAVPIEAAQALLGCGRSQVFELLRAGALHRAPKVGKGVMVTTASIEALQESKSREPSSRLKRQPPAQREAGRRERDAILKLIRSTAAAPRPQDRQGAPA